MAAVFRINRFNRRNRRRRPQRLPNNVNPLDQYTEEECIRRFRFDKDGVYFIRDLFVDDLTYETRRNYPISPLIQILVFLRFVATGSFQIVIGDLIKISQPSISRIVTRISNLFCQPHIVRRFIKWPTNQADITHNQREFHGVAGFPRAVACIDCTHIRILAPVVNEAVYVGRKGYHSLNIQGACDSKGEIINLVARWPGSANDSKILAMSSLHDDYENGTLSGIVLGDGGYPCRNWLMTPYTRPTTPQQRAYNRAHKKTRSKIERVFGIWKRIFAVLHQEIRLNPQKTCKIVTACAGT